MSARRARATLGPSPPRPPRRRRGCSTRVRTGDQEGVIAMPYANNQGVRTHYEVEGAGPPLVLLHGLTASPEQWRFFGVVDELKHGYQLILIDGRGHGASDKPHDPAAYSQEAMAGDFVAVLDQLGVPRAYYWGTSMGGETGFALPDTPWTGSSPSSWAASAPSGVS